MTDKNLNELLTELNDALESIEEIDPETRELVKDLDEDINRLLESGEQDVDGVVDRAQTLETRFALEHPVAERFFREIIDALSRVGI
jgi:phosphate uptake regulator